MSYTNFRFPSLPERAIIKINGTPAVVGAWYNQGSAVKIEKKNSFHFSEPYDQYTYQTTNGTLTSGISTIIINVPPDKTTPPESVDSNEVINNSDAITLKDILPINNAVDRIKILNFSTTGSLELNGNNVFPNSTIFRYDLENLIFTAEDEGLGNPYHTITYQVGNSDGLNTSIYTLSFEIQGQSSLINLIETDGVSVDPTGTNPNIHYKEATIKVADGFVGLTANLTFQGNLSASAFPAGTDNQIILNYGTQEETIQDTNIRNLAIPIGGNGFVNILIVLGVIEDDLPVTGTLDFQLIDIDGDSTKVSTTNSVSLNVDF